jgi:hypothetical protein
MKRTAFYCDVCRRDVGRESGIAIAWGGINGAGPVPKTTRNKAGENRMLVQYDFELSDAHICNDCIKDIGELAQRPEIRLELP